ncbi:hypothetical protein HUG10_16590 [Halorarum halophilum]|uniref:Uncharacterized protein n=2 Tax=Halorarum halophilum TaxID=2743090 RepID=A0A7D5GZI1_9EURY|nr:hypothetical protein HUG10_16590 [Halobaculum halophilum]
MPRDPDPESDLGYRLLDLDVLHSSDGENEHTLVLPSDEDLLRENAFIVANPGLVCDLKTMV